MKDTDKKKGGYEKLDYNYLLMVMLMWPFPIDKYKHKDRTYILITCMSQSP